MFKLNLGLLDYLVNDLKIITEEWQFWLLNIGFVLLGITVAYLLGSINTAIVISKVFYHDDIRKYGSGNAGLTNMLRTYGKGAAGLTLLGDMLKTALAILFTGCLFGFHYMGGISLNDGYCYMAGLFAVVGHVFPIYYGFKGGKGVLVTATMALILTPIPFLFLLAIFIIVVALSKYVSLGSVTAAVLYPVAVNAYINIFLSGKAPAILVFHGLSGASGSWLDFVKFAAQGYVVAALDSRGQGGFSEDVGGVPGTTFSTPFMRGFDGEPRDLHCCDLFLDTAQLAKVVMGLDFVDETRVAATGGSQGGALTLACASLVPSLKLCAPTYPYLCDYKRVWEMDLAKGAYDGIRYYLRSYDPTHAHIDEFFTKLGYIDLQFLAPRIKAKVYMSTGLMDTTCPPSTQFAAFNKITAEKTVEIYPDFGHEGLKGSDERIYNFICENL